MTKKWAVPRKPQGIKRMPGIVGRLALVVALLVVLYVVTALVVIAVFPAKVYASCSADSDGRLVINVQRSHLASAWGFSVRLKGQDKNDALWNVYLGSQKSYSVPYGQVPDDATQYWPRTRGPVEDIPYGSVFRITVSYRGPLHLSIFSPAIEQFTFRMSEDGVPIPAPDEAWWPDEIPSAAR